MLNISEEILSQLSDEQKQLLKSLQEEQEVVLKGAQKWFEEKSGKYGWLVGVDLRNENDPANWHSKVVGVCECGFCGGTFRRQACDIHTAGVNGQGCCPECRKTVQKEAKKAAREGAKEKQARLEAEIEALKSSLKKAVNE